MLDAASGDSGLTNRYVWAGGRDGPLWRAAVIAMEVIFRRGFVAAVTCPADLWLAHGDAIRHRHPVREVTLTTCPGIDFNPDGLDGYARLRGRQRLVSLGKYVAAGSSYDPNALPIALLAAEWPGIAFLLPPIIDVRWNDDASHTPLGDFREAARRIEEEVIRGLGVLPHLLGLTGTITEVATIAAAARHACPNENVLVDERRWEPRTPHRVIDCRCELPDYFAVPSAAMPAPVFYLVRLEPRAGYLSDLAGVAYRWADGRCPRCRRVYVAVEPVGLATPAR